MSYKKIEYQENSLKTLLMKIQKHGSGKYMFKAPTGSGKTVIMSKFLAKFTAESKDDYAFIWASPRKNLPLQSRERMGENNALDCVLTNTIIGNQRIEKNQVWFVNWEKMSRGLLDETERGTSLMDIVRNTRNDNLKIMLLIDEAHWGAQKIGTKVQHAIDEVIIADITVYITATPKNKIDKNHTVEIELQDVKDEEMIVSEIPLNYDLKDDDITMQADEKLLTMACERRKILKEQYKEAGTTINPLLMIQIPNSKEGEIKREIVEKILKKYGLTEENGNFMSLEEGRRNDVLVKNISDNDNEIDAVIFKQNVALGWDCPRAKLLVGLRDTKEPTFKLQTLGRIMRMPEQKYYKNDELNLAYFYSEGIQFDDPEGTIQNLLRGTVKSKQKSGSSMKALPSVRIRRIDPTEQLDTEEFKRTFCNNAEEMDIVNRIRRVQEVELTSLTRDDDITAGRPDASSPQYATLQNEMLIQKDFENKLGSILSSNEVECRCLFDMESIKILLKEAIYEMYQNTGQPITEDKIYYRLRDTHNAELLKHPVIATMNNYEDTMRNLVNEGIDQFDWSVPKIQLLALCNDDEPAKNTAVHKNCVRDYGTQFKNYAMEPTYLEIASNLELRFCRTLDRSNMVKWWYKNGVGREDFAIVYYDGCRPRKFMPDFIVMMKNKRIGIFDTKAGETLVEAELKARALYEYTKKHQKLKLYGGIVTERGMKWIINDGSNFTTNLGDRSWINLEL